MEKILYKYIPEEILYDILKRLPSKSLCRFVLVCKSWCKLITSKAFISSNLNHNLDTQSNTHMLLDVFRPNKNLYHDGYYWEDFFFYHQTTISEGINKSIWVQSFKATRYSDKIDIDYSMLGTCNGLVCLYDISNNNDVILWNPSIHKIVQLPYISYHQRLPVFGFGVNLLNGDFKVIRVIVSHPSPPLVPVFSLKKGEWIEIHNVPQVTLSRGHHMYLNGRSHWFGNVGIVYYEPWGSIISFDMSDEVFRIVSVPKQLAQECSYDDHWDTYARMMTMTLREKECLAVARGCSVWVMKEYGVLESWTKIYSIDMKFMWSLPAKVSPRFIRFIMKNGNILLSDKEGKLACYDPFRESVFDLSLDILGLGDGTRWSDIDKYTESLVLLEPRFAI